MYRKQKGDIRDTIMNFQDYFTSRTAKLLRDRGFVARKRKGKLYINTPQGVKDVQLENVSGLLELVDTLEAMFKPKESIYKEPPDVAIINKSGQFPEEKLPEHYDRYIMPKTRVDMSRIRDWVDNKKTKGMTNGSLTEEYNEWQGTNLDSISSEQEESLKDSMTFRIARKIWYVGRRPASLKDHEWDLITSKMRPKRGTFSRNEKWTNMRFPYTQSYSYESGVTK